MFSIRFPVGWLQLVSAVVSSFELAAPDLNTGLTSGKKKKLDLFKQTENIRRITKIPLKKRHAAGYNRFSSQVG